ncbi:MAG: hypothetical protein ACLTYN_10525 [Dysosmobacter welbionis]
MDTVVDRLIRYAKVYSESDYHAGRTVTPARTASSTWPSCW